MSVFIDGAIRFLCDMSLFSRLVLRVPLRPYQLAPLKPIIESVLRRQGREFLLIFPRQSGKNEAVAQLLVYLLNLLQRTGGQMVYGATADALGLGAGRLEARLDNAWNTQAWHKGRQPVRRCLGRACVLFLSTHPSASARGQTADWLLVIDEAQDQVGAHIESVFTPMRAAGNATAVYTGTVKLTTDFLWQKKVELEAEQARDGAQRVFLVKPAAVMAANPAYRIFLDRQVRKHGRHHPIIASEYFLEPVDGSGGLFPERRRILMQGSHGRQRTPVTGRVYVATLDVAGEDEAATDALAQLENPGRDYTVATIFEVEFPRPGVYAPGPTYRAVDVFVDHGSKHFQDYPGRPALVHRLLGWLEGWHPSHLLADESGVGQGLVSWLTAALGAHRVTGYSFAAPAKKAGLGSALVSLVETGRFRYWSGDSTEPLTDAWWFWQQVGACGYEVPPDGQFDRDLRWGVPASHRTQTPTGPQPTHDDRLLSAALVAELDRLYRTGKLVLGAGKSDVIEAVDPLSGHVY